MIRRAVIWQFQFFVLSSVKIDFGGNVKLYDVCLTTPSAPYIMCSNIAIRVSLMEEREDQ